MNNEFRDYNRESLNMLKSKSMKDVKQVTASYYKMNKDYDSVDSLLQYWESRIGGNSIHTILQAEDDTLVHKTLLGVASGDDTLVNDEMLVVKNDVTQFIQNTSYKDANKLIESAKKGFDSALVAKQSRIDSINAEFEKVKLEFYQYQNHMRGWEIKEYQDKIYGYEELTKDYNADPKVKLINEKLEIYQRQYAFALAKVRQVNELYADEIKQIEHEDLMNRLRNGDI